MIERLPGGQSQHRRLFRIGFVLADSENFTAVLMTALGDLIGDVMHLQHGGVAFHLGHEGADALHPDQKAFAGQFTQRPVDGHAADAQLINQFTF